MSKGWIKKLNCIGWKYWQTKYLTYGAQYIGCCRMSSGSRTSFDGIWRNLTDCFRQRVALHQVCNKLYCYLSVLFCIVLGNIVTKRVLVHPNHSKTHPNHSKTHPNYSKTYLLGSKLSYNHDTPNECVSLNCFHF